LSQNFIVGLCDTCPFTLTTPKGELKYDEI
jgi:hypothetical protein